MDITVIIPIHEYNDTVKQYLTLAIESVKTQQVEPKLISIVSNKEINDQIKKDFNENIKFFNNTGSLKYQDQINFAVSQCKTKYFSILGFDDTYTAIWFKNVEKYITHHPEISVYLPITRIIDINGEDIQMVNELALSGFVEERGIIDGESLEKYQDFSVNGGVFRVDDFLDVGGLKNSIELSFWYEFLLRAVSKSLSIMVIPRIGYKHLFGREGSMAVKYNETMDLEEKLYWIKIATKEAQYTKQRNKGYKYIPKEKK